MADGEVNERLPLPNRLGPDEPTKTRGQLMAEATENYEVLDVDGLIGVHGHREPLRPDDWYRSGGERDRHTEILSIGMLMAINACTEDDWLDTWTIMHDEGDGTDPVNGVAERIMGLVAARKAKEASTPLVEALEGMCEPMRTVAINCLFDEVPTEEVARGFGTSVETIQFLLDVALDQLATHVHID